VTETMASGKFETSLVKDVIPFIEKRYRVIANKNNRAIAGFQWVDYKHKNQQRKPRPV